MSSYVDAADLETAREFFANTRPVVGRPRTIACCATRRGRAGSALVRRSSAGAAAYFARIRTVRSRSSRDLQDLLSQIGRQRRAAREEVVDLLERLGDSLAADESAEPRAEEEDAAVLLNPREAVERRREIGQRERRVIRPR